MAAVHEVAEVREAIRQMLNAWVVGGNLNVPYLIGVALEESILQLIRDLSTAPEEVEMQ